MRKMQRSCVLASPRSWKESSAEPDEGRRRALSRLLRRNAHVRRSSDTSDRVSASRSCSTASSAWSTAATTRPASRSSRTTGLDYVRAVGPLDNLKARAGVERLDRDDRPRPHALGDARRRHRGERAPARRLRRGEALDRPQRHRRELPRAHGEPRRPTATRSRPRPTPRPSRTSSSATTRATSSRPSGSRSTSSRGTSRSS